MASTSLFQLPSHAALIVHDYVSSSKQIVKW